jgi:hypothetical protein
VCLHLSGKWRYDRHRYRANSLHIWLGPRRRRRVKKKDTNTDASSSRTTLPRRGPPKKRSDRVYCPVVREVRVREVRLNLVLMSPYS